MLKAGAEVSVDWLKMISDKIWETETISKDWKNQVIVPINKQGFRSQCKNYRGIALLCVANKIFGRAVLNRMQNIVESHLGKNQCSFRPNRGCCGQVCSARILMQRAIEFNKAIYICFVDLQKAYNILNRDALWEVLKKSFNIPDKIICIIKALNSSSVGVIRDTGELSEELPINVGVKEGDVSPPMLFNMYFDTVIKVALKHHPDKGIQLDYTNSAPLIHNSRHKLERSTIVQNLAYAVTTTTISITTSMAATTSVTTLTTTTTSVITRTVCLQVSPPRGVGHHEDLLNSTTTTMSETTTTSATITPSATTHTLTPTTILVISLTITSVTITPIQTTPIATTRIRTTLQRCQSSIEKT